MYNVYSYSAEILSVYDGDSVRASIDLGFGIKMENQKVRLFGINAPEVRGDNREAGIVSRDYLRDLVMGKTVTLITVKDTRGKYGRYLGTLYIKGENDELVSVNDLLVSSGNAVERVY